MSWSAKQYVAFEDERTRPVRDLLAAVPNREVRRAIDLGCGPGNSTEVLAATFPGAALSGLDSSTDMIAAAKTRLPSIAFETGSIESWEAPEPFDLIFANAALQWVPDHATLFPRLLAHLTPNGSLAVQMPDNMNQPSHKLMQNVAAEQPWRSKLSAAADARAAIGTPSWYYELLRRSCRRVDVWRTTYHHPLAGGAAGIVEWFKATGLRPFLAPLDEDERQAFLQRYQAAVAQAYPALPDGTVLLPFPRLFIVATR